MVCCSLLTSAWAQIEKNYTPRDSYNSKSKELLRQIDDRHEIQLERVKPEHPEIYEQYYQITKELKSILKSGKFIKDESLESFIQRIYNKIIESNEFTCTPSNILLVRSLKINAICYGEGTIVLTTGLLARMESEDELAFVIAHELAHYEKDHIHAIMLNYLNSRVREQSKRILKKSLKGQASVKNIKKTTGLLYGLGSFSRSMEMKADSLSLIYLTNAGFNPKGAISALNKLDSLEQRYPALGIGLFNPLNITKYPFKNAWMIERSLVYSRETKNVLFMSYDLLKSHPDISIRRSILQKNIGHNDNLNKDDTGYLADSVKWIPWFEAVHGGYLNKEFDLALYYALYLKRIFPRNRFLTTTIASILVDTYEARSRSEVGEYVSKFTTHYGADLKMVNTFLHNIYDKEILDLAFHFLNHQVNFDPTNEQHYYLLYRICTLSKRHTVRKNIVSSYHQAFPDGKYLKLMR